MAGRPHGDEGVRRFPIHHLVDGERDAADSAQGRLQAAGRHRGVGIEPHQAVRRRGAADRLDILHRVGQRDDLVRRARRLFARQRLEPLVLQCLLDSAQPFRPLRMSHRILMVKTGRMADEQGGHSLHLNSQPCRRKCLIYGAVANCSQLRTPRPPSDSRPGVAGYLRERRSLSAAAGSDRCDIDRNW
jgi:hypothetical protein